MSSHWELMRIKQNQQKDDEINRHTKCLGKAKMINNKQQQINEINKHTMNINGNQWTAMDINKT